MYALLLLAAPPAAATTYDTRITLGAFVSNENFAQALDGQTANDFAVVSSRFFMKASDIGSGRLELITDLRDKQDFFEKLDSQLLQLTPQNNFQLRQLSLRLPSDHPGLAAVVGRFPLPEAGSVNLDGVAVDYRWNGALKSSIFGGLNPKRPDQTYMEFNSDSQTFGTYTLYQPKSENWGHYFYMSNAGVANLVQAHVDRLYWFNNTIYQWNEPNQLSVMSYLDFTPRVYVQTAYVSYIQELSKALVTTTNYMTIDVIEYSRRQGVLSVLSPSPYQEASFQLRQRLTGTSSLQYYGSWGVRGADGLIHREFSFGPTFSKFISSHFSAQAIGGYRRDFTADETFVRANIGYYSKDWEFTLDHDQGYSVQPSDLVYHPMIDEFGISRFFSRELYGTISLQRAHDERVDIYTGYFRIGYRFGSEGAPPVRDGAPPRGRL